MARIFISYRHDDTEGHAGRLLDELKKCIGADCIFMDAEGIGPGLSFRRILQAQLATCEVMLVVIGKGWTEIKDKSGKRRLDHLEDFVRLEIGTALKRGIPVVPVLVQGAILPAETELPDELKPLAERQAYVLRHDRWKSDIKLLVDKLSSMVPSIAQAARNHLGASSSVSADTHKTNTLFTKTSFLVWVSSIIAIGVSHQIILIRDWNAEVLYYIWLIIGLLMGVWHAARTQVNTTRDVVLGCAIAVSGVLVMSLSGTLIFKLPFLPKELVHWRDMVTDMTVIMISFVAGGASWPLLRGARRSGR